ncbi:MAG: endo-1,4-beta-xylanase [Tepidisphaeraceae bacterium]
MLKSITLVSLAVTAAATPFAAADWLSDANARIAQYRQGTLTVKVVDGSGKPLNNATVGIHETQSAFTWGTTIAPGYWANTSDPNNATYRQKITSLFDSVTPEYGLTWPSYETTGLRTQADNAINWATSHGLSVRGQHLMWQDAPHVPDDVETAIANNNLSTVASRALNHITDEVTHYKGKTSSWSVLNEAWDKHMLTDALNPGVPQEQAPAMTQWFNAAHAADPNASLYTNDYGILASNNATNNAHQQSYFKTIQSLKQQGAPVDTIGFQSHFGSASAATTPANLVTILNKFATLGTRMAVTEFDMYGDGWTEQSKADYLRNFMTVIFAQPQMDSFTNWGFWDSQHWQGSGLLYDANWNLKLTGQAYLDLVFNQWWTDLTAQTTAGQYATRGYLGNYTIDVTANGITKTQAVTLGADGTTLLVTVPEPASLAAMGLGVSLLARRRRA